jgi:hypothetical protein
MIGLEDNFLEEEECKNLIRIFIDWSVKSKAYRDIHVLHLYEVGFELDLIDQKFCYEICERVNKRINQITNKKYFMEAVTLSLWPKNSKQNFHIDKTRAETDYTSVTYLNQDFQGGKTLVFEDTNQILTCSPKIGRTLCFEGKKLIHAVTPIESQDRFTLNIWYSLNRRFQIKKIKNDDRRNC